MNEIISKSIADNLIKLKGEVRGLAIKSHGDFIVKEKGEGALKQLEDFMDSLGYPLNHRQMASMKFYPVGIEVIELLAIKHLFNFDDEKFFEIGAFSSKLSLIMKTFMKYFVSIRMMVSQAPNIWRKYYTVGNLTVPELNEKKKYLVLKLEDLNLHYLHCLHLKGYFASVVKMVVGREVRCEERQCVHKQGTCHEFVLKW